MQDVQSPPADQVDTVRRFNRFYTRQIGALEEGLLRSDFSLTEARILFELAYRPGLMASDLVRDLGLDAGYLSRILKSFEERGFLVRRASASDARQALLALTDAGLEAFRPLERATQDDVAAALGKLAESDRARLVGAMELVERLLGGAPEPDPPFALRDPRPGDIGWIIHRQGVLYHQEYDWDETYEALVAEILAGFVKNFAPGYERAWIAEREGHVVGSVFVVRKTHEIAKLRLLYVEPSARGLGIGGRLVDECIDFARERGYRTLTLWTNDILVSARRIYEAAGFRLVGEDRHHAFGKDLVGQDWSLDL